MEKMTGSDSRWVISGVGLFLVIIFLASGTAQAVNQFKRAETNEYHLIAGPSSDLQKANFHISQLAAITDVVGGQFINTDPTKICARVNSPGTLILKAYYENADGELDFIYTNNHEQSINLLLDAKCSLAVLPIDLVEPALELKLNVRHLWLIPDSYPITTNGLSISEIEPEHCGVLGGPVVDCESHSEKKLVLAEIETDDSILGYPSQASCPHT